MALQCILLAALVAGAFAGPIFTSDSSTCAQTCPEGSATFSPGKTYTYDYASTITTSIPGTTDGQSTLSLTATAHIDVFAPCDMALRLTEVFLRDSDPSQPGSEDNVERAWSFKQALQERVLRFGIASGRVQDLCPHREELGWVLNVKKAILSGLQISVPTTIDEPITVTETDVVGECEVTYSPLEGSWSTTKLSKTKDLLSCKSRQNAESIFQSIPYEVPSNIQSLPLLKSTHECEHEVDSTGKLTKTSCNENHVFRPFSRGNSGATTRVTTELVFRQETVAENLAGEPVERRTDMLFEHMIVEDNQEVTKRDALLSLRALCAESTDGVGTNAPAQFATLVKQMKKLDSQSLTEISQRTPRICDKATKFFQDALPALGTTASVSVMRTLVMSGGVDRSEADLWMNSLTFINEPTAEMLEEVKPLLTVYEPSMKAVLAVSALVHSYCRNEPECADHTQVTAIMELLEPMLNGNCIGDRDKVLMALKAIGNTGVAHGVVPTLGRCFLNGQAPMELRVAAVNAFRRMGCYANMEDMRTLFLDAEADSELRINAYLMLMECPSYSTLNDVYGMLEREQVNQVGSFIWTHLTNLLETRSPIKQDIRNILDNSALKQAFDLDKRKFSRNIEWSGFSDALNAGATVDSNLIWSSKSFLPRSATVNLTVDLFGESINLMEVGGRVEGMDSILEKFFSNEEDNNIPNSRSAVNPSYIETMDQTFRPAEIEPKGSYFLRVFGTEIRYADFHGLDLSTIKDKFNYLQWIVNLSSEQEYEMTKSVVLLDADIAVPTACGLPLKLSVDGSAVLDVKLKGKADLRNLLSSGSRGVDINGMIRPSAGLQIEATMGVDAWVAHTGLKMTNTFHTSTMADGTIHLQEGTIFNMDINMPNEQMEIFKAESKFFVTYRDNEIEQAMSRGGGLELNRCLGGTLESALGLELCGDLSLPALTTDEGPWFPLTGPASLSLVLNKRDTFTQYHLEGRMLAERVSSGVFNYIASASFNTPGSTIDRELGVNFDLNQATKSVRFDLRSPWKKIDMSANLEVTDELKKLTGRAVLDEDQEYSATAELQLSETTYRKKYDTSVTISIPDRDQIGFTGAIQYRSGKRLDLDFALKNVLEKPMKLKGMFKKSGRGVQGTYTTEVSLKVADLKSQFDGSLDLEKSRGQYTSSSQAELKYKLGDGAQEQFSVNHQAQIINQPDNKQASLSCAMANSIEPAYDTDLTLMLSKDTSTMAAQFQLGLTNDKPKRISFDTRAAYVLDVNDLSSVELDTSLNLAMPWKDIAYEGVFKHKHSDSEFSSMGEVKYGGEDSAQFELSLKKESMEPLMLSARAGMKYPGRDLLYVHSLQERTPNVYHHELTITLDAYERVRLTSTYTKADVHQLVAELTTPFTETMQLEAEMKARLIDFDTKARFLYGSDEYSTAANWRYESSRRTMATNAMFELAYPGRKVIVDGTLSRNGDALSANLETKYDATRDMMKKIVGSIELDMTPSQPTFTIRSQWWPNKFVELSGNLKKDSQGWFQVTSDIEGAIHLTSSCPNVGAIHFEFSHERSPTTFITHVEASWDANKKIDFDINLSKTSDWRNTQALMTLSTPFETLRLFKVEGSQSCEPGAINSNSKVQWNSEEMALTFSGSFDMSNNLHSGNLHFTSPFQGYENILLTGTHRFVPGEMATHASANLGASRSYSVDLTMSHDRTGWYITNRGELTIDMPMRTRLTWNHNNNAREITTHAEFQLNDDRSVFDLYGKMRRKSQMSASLTTPYFPHMTLSGSHEAERRTWKNIQSALEVSYGPKTLKLENDFSFEMYRQFSLSTKFTSPFSDFEDLSLMLDNKLEGETITAKNEIKWTSNDKITLEGTLTRPDTMLFDGELSFTSPFTEDFNMVASNRKLEETFILTGNMNYGRTRMAQTTFKLNPSQMISMEFTAPHDYLRNMKFMLQLSGEPKNGVWTCEINHFKLTSPMKAELQANINYVNPSMNLQIETPFREVRFLRSTMTHRRSSGNCDTHFTFEIPQYTITLHNGNQVRSSTDFTSNSYIEYESGKRIELDLTVNGLSGSAKITTPFEELQLLEGSFEHSSGRNNFADKLELKYNANTISAESTITTRDPYNMRFSINSNLEWPHDIDLTVSHAGSLTDFQNSGTLTINGERYTTANTFALRDNNLEMDLNINDMFVVTFTSSGEARNYRNRGSMVMYGQRYTTANSIIFADNRLEMNIDINDMYKLTLSHSGPINNFQNSATLEINGEHYTTTNSFALHGNNLAVSININDMYELTFSSSGSATNTRNSGSVRMFGQHYTTANSFVFGDNEIALNIDINDMYQLTFNHKGPINDFENSGTLNIDGQRYTMANSFSLEGNNLAVSININNMYELTFSSSGSATNNRNSGSVRLYDQRYSTANSFVFSDNRIELSIDINDMYQLTFNHEGPINNFENSGTLNINGRRYTMANKFSLHGNNLALDFNINDMYQITFSSSGSATNNRNSGSIRMLGQHYTTANSFVFGDNRIELNIDINEMYQLTFRHNGPINDFENSGTMTINGQRYTMANSFALRENSLDVSINMNDQYRLTISHSGTLTDFENSLVIPGRYPFGFTSSFKLEGSTLESSLTVQTPYDGYRNMAIHASHSGSWDNMNSNLRGNIEDKSASIETLFKYRENYVEAELKLTTPFEECESASFGFKHTGPLTNFNNEITYELNGETINTVTTFQLMSRRMTLTFNGRAPSNEATLQLQHTGQLTNFENDLTLNYNGREITAGSEFKLLSDKMEVEMRLRTPYRQVRNFAVSMTHTGDSREFSNVFTGTLNRQAITTSTGFKLDGSRLQASFELNTPWRSINAFGVNIEHNGAATDFTNVITVAYNDNTITNNVDFKWTNEKRGSLRLSTPFEELRTLTLGFAHTGRWMRNMNTEVTTSINGRNIGFNVEFKFEGGSLDSSISLTSPEVSFSAAARHSGETNNFHNSLSASLNGDSISKTTTFRMAENDIEGSIRIETPFEGFTDMGMSFKHAGPKYNCESEFRTNLEHSEIESTLTFKWLPEDYGLSMKIETPIAAMRNLEFGVKSEGGLRDFQQEGIIAFNQYRGSLKNMFKMDEQIEARMELETPWNQVRQAEISFTHAGRLTNFNSNGMVKINDDTYTGTTEFRIARSQLRFLGRLNIPEEYSVELDHRGPFNDFTNTLQIKFADRTISENTAFKLDGNNVEASWELTTPFESMETTQITFTHEGGLDNFKQESRIGYNGKSITHKAEFTFVRRQVTGKFEMTSPCPYFETFSIDMNHQGRWVDFENSITIELNGVEYKGNSEFKVYAKKMVGEASIKIPQEYSIRVIHKGEIADFTNIIRANMNGDNVNINSAFKMTDQVIEGSARVQTPYDGHDEYSADFSFRNKRRMKISGSLQTPHESFRTMSFEMKHEGNWRAFSTEGKLQTPLESLPEVIFDISHRRTRNSLDDALTISYGEKQIAGSVAFSNSDEKREASMSLETPFMYVRQIGFTYTENKSPATFAFDMNWNGRRIDGNLSFKTDPNVELAATLRTPWNTLREFNMNIVHRGTLTNFACTGTITVNGEGINGNLEFRKDGAAIESSGTINLPISNYERFGFTISHNGDPSNMRSSADFNSPVGDFSLLFTFEGTLTNFRSTAHIETPFEVLRSANAALNHQGTIEDFTCSGEVEYKDQKIEGQLTFKKEGRSIATTLSLTTPFEVMPSLQISTEHHPTSDSLTGQIDITYDGVKYIDLDYSLGTGSTPSAALNMRAPRRMQGTARYSRDAQSTTARGSFNWDGQEYAFGLQNAKDLELSLELPDRILRLRTSWELTAEKFAHQAMFQWEDSDDKKISYDVEVTRSSRGRQNIYDGRVVLTNKFGSLTTTFNHQVNPGRRYTSVVTIQNLTLRQNLILSRSREMKLTLTAQHPTFQRDVVIDVEGVIEPETPRIDGKISAEYADQQFEFSVKFADESSSGSDRRYIAEAHLTHPASALDVQFSTALTNNRESMGGNFDVSYMMARDQQIKNAALRAQINKIREELNMEVSTPVKRVSMTGRRTLSDESEGRQQFTVTGNVDDHNIEAQLDLDRLSPSIDMKLTYNPDEMLHVYGKYLDPSTIKFEAYHERDGGRIQDSELSLRLSNKNTINGRAYARASILDDIRAAWAIETELGATVQRIKNDFVTEVEARSGIVSNAIAPLQSTMTQFGGYIGGWYENMVENNDFYARDIRFVTAMVISEALEEVRLCVVSLRESFEALQTRINEHMETCAAHRDAILQRYQDAKTLVYNTVDHAKTVTYQYALDTYEQLRQHPYMDIIKEKLTPVYELVKQRAQILQEKYYEVVDELQRLYGDVMAEPAMQYLKEYTDAIIEYIGSIGEYVEFSEEAKAWFAQVREMGWTEIRERAITWARDQISLFKFEITTWEPSQALFEAMLRVPIDMQDLRSLPDLHIAERFEQLKDIITTCTPTFKAPEYNYSFWDTFYKYKPSTEIRDWVPPFEGHAFLSGNSNYMTFDRHFFNFAGDCSYLLARDFIDGRFSIIVNYNNGVKSSITVISDDTQIEITPDSVTVAGSRVELPIVTSAVTIRRIGNTVRIDRTQGLTVTCDLINDHCSFNVSGWYYGKTGGLLGTYDNEPSNDMTTSTQTLADSTEDFVQSWSSGGRCSTNYARTASLNTESSRYQACARYFESNSSPMRPCFRQVDTPAFMTMCINEVAESNNIDESVCKIAASYREECSRVGVPVDLPTPCVKCDMADGRSMIKGEELTLTTTSKTSDVVLAVSHGSCNQEIIERLADLVERLDNNLQAEGYTNNRFGLVGFANTELLREPHSHTFRGELMTTANRFNLNNFQMVEEGPEDVLTAVKFASKYPFRAGASKAIVVVPCDTCSEMATSYSSILSLLTSQDIRLHTLAQHSFTLKTQSPKTSFIFGVDSRSLYTTKDVRDNQLTGDLDLRRQVNMPRDLCSALGEVTHGSYFNINQLLHSRTNVQKKFADVFTRLVAKKSSTSECQRCQCVSDEYTGVGKTVCESCEADLAFVPWIGPEVAEQQTRPIERPSRRRGGRRGNRNRS